MEKAMYAEHANTIPISEILGKLDLKPLRQEDPVLYYPSLWDRKRLTTLVVNTQTNRWSDATTQQGTLVELVVYYLKSHCEAHTEIDAIRWINNMNGSFLRAIPDLFDKQPPVELRRKKAIQYPGLLHYLRREGITLNLARQYLKEIHVRNRQTGNDFIALGLPTVDGGFALRTAYLERYIGQPAISFIRGRVAKPKGIHLFKEGMDYLSLLSHIGQMALDEDAIILNAWYCLCQVPGYIRQYGYQTMYSWLDNTTQGDQATASLGQFVQTEAGVRHRPMNKLYTAHDTVHAWYHHQRGPIA